MLNREVGRRETRETQEVDGERGQGEVVSEKAYVWFAAPLPYSARDTTRALLLSSNTRQELTCLDWGGVSYCDQNNIQP